MSDISIEQVASTELDRAATILLEQVYPGDLEATHRHLDGHADGASTTFFVWVAGRFAGYLTIRWVSNYLEFSRRNIPLIHHLAVFPQFRRRGVATLLMDAAERLIGTRATTAGITVGIFDEYGPAQRLYAKRGYVPDGRGACLGQRPLTQGEIVTIDHDLILWLTKSL